MFFFSISRKIKTPVLSLLTKDESQATEIERNVREYAIGKRKIYVT